MRKSIVCLLALAVTASASAGFARDTVHTYSQGALRGRITAMSPTQVSIDTNPVVENVSVGDIQYISYADEPTALGNARNRVRNSQYDVAMQQLRGINVEDIGKTEVRQDIQFLLAKSQAGLALAGAPNSDVSAAGTALATFIRNHPGSYHFIEANMLLGDLLVSAGRVDNAMRYYDTVEKAPWPEAKMQVSLAKALAHQRQQQWEQALPLFRAVAGSNLQGPRAERMKLSARLGEAAALAGTGQLDQGLQLIRNVVLAAEKGDYSLHARAYNTLGAAYQAAQKPKDALLAYLHTDVLYFQDAEFHAEALANLAQLWGQVDNPQRKLDAERRLRTQYPGSRWARQ